VQHLPGMLKTVNLHFFKELILVRQDRKNWGFGQKEKEDFDFLHFVPF
jgi:prenyltransferase beta subunit